MEGYLLPMSFTGQTSNWSNIQTITIPGASTSPDPTPTPTVPESPTWIILPLCAVVMLLSTVFRKRIPTQVKSK